MNFLPLQLNLTMKLQYILKNKIDIVNQFLFQSAKTPEQYDELKTLQEDISEQIDRLHEIENVLFHYNTEIERRQK